jgi:hypothetical protein
VHENFGVPLCLWKAEYVPITLFRQHNARQMHKASLSEKFAMIGEHWRPKVVAQLNGQELKLLKFEGVFTAQRGVVL